MPMTYRFPKGMRPSTLEEREIFYKREFKKEDAISWLKHRDIANTAFAVIVGRHSNIYKRKFKEIKNKAVIIDEHRNFQDVLDYVLYYLPEGFYYDRNVYRNIKDCQRCNKPYKDCWDCEGFLGQELAFDVDPENITCPYHGDLKKKMERRQGMSFCMIEFKRARKLTLELYEELKKEYRKIRIAYSGRGFHIHVLDKKAVRLSKEEREEIAKHYSGYAIDEWVTNGEMRLIRLPYSLNGLVSRVCLPLRFEEVKSFDPRSMAIPSFLL